MKHTGLLYCFFLLFFSLPQLHAQNCSCPEYYSWQSEQQSKDANSKLYIDQLLASSNTICQARGYEWMAMDYSANKNFDSADIYFYKTEKLYKQSGCNDSVFLNLYKKWAELYYTKSDFAKTQEYCFKLLEAAKSLGSPIETGTAYTMIAQVLNQTGQAEKGITYTRLAIPFLKKIGDPAEKADLLFKLSKRYLWHYQDTKTSSSLDSSELFSIQQLAIARQINHTSSIAKAFSNLEGVAWERSDFKKAIEFLDSSFVYTDPDDIATLSTNYFDKADLYIELKDFKAAAAMADSCLYYRQLSGNAAYVAETYELISRIAWESGDYRKAYEYREMGRTITDSVRNVEKTKIVSELEKKYTQAKNEKKIQNLAQQKRIYFLFALAGLLGLVALGFFLRQQSLKNKQKVLETEQRLNRARMNPHFFFNALSSLQSFALQGNDGKSIATNLSKFSHIMRETLESTYKEYVTVEQETDFLNEYLELQKTRFPQKFTYEITAAGIEAEDTLIPSMILQPFAENSIEHGFTGISYPGQISIQFEKAGNDLQIKITDNGKGLSAIAKEESEHISRASQIIKDRIYLLNLKLKTKASFTIENNKNEKGVAVLVKLPLLYKQDVKD